MGAVLPTADDVTREFGLLHRLYKPTVFSAIARALPDRLHPNTITVSGQVCAVAGAIAAYCAARGLGALYPLSALLHFSYLTADNVDGMHARRTQQVSRVGELLDHGLDGIAIVSLALTFGFVLRVDGLLLATMTLLAALSFLLAHWEHRQTGRLGPVTAQADGFTLGAGLCLAAFFLDEPPWLRFSFEVFNAASVLAGGLAGAALVAIAGPLVRAARRRSTLTALPGSLLALSAVYWLACAGAPGLVVAVTIGILGTDLGTRAIHLRLLGSSRGLLGWSHALLLSCMAAALVERSLLLPCATLGLAVSACGYVATLVQALRTAQTLDDARERAG